MGSNIYEFNKDYQSSRVYAYIFMGMKKCPLFFLGYDILKGILLMI